MKFSYAWLADYVELPTASLAAAERLASDLTSVGLSVEGIEEVQGDLVLDVEVTSNRPDCMNHLGLAREIAVKRGLPLRLPAALADVENPSSGARASVRVEDGEACPRFTLRIVRGLRIGPSPDWLVRRLEAIGARSINNVVDVTNYVMLELILTRVYEKQLVKAAQGLRFLVLDELHTYRGRQGADVALLVRRAREFFGAKQLQVVGTSATLAGPGTYDQQQAEVAAVATVLFGAEVTPADVIGETLQREDVVAQSTQRDQHPLSIGMNIERVNPVRRIHFQHHAPHDLPRFRLLHVQPILNPTRKIQVAVRGESGKRKFFMVSGNGSLGLSIRGEQVQAIIPEHGNPFPTGIAPSQTAFRHHNRLTTETRYFLHFAFLGKPKPIASR